MFILKVIHALEKFQVDYAIVGGFAVTLHGVIRGTVDLDIVLGLTQEAFEGGEKALKSLGLVGRLPVTAKDVFNFREEYIKNRNLIAWSFYDPINPAHIVDIIITQDLRKIKTVQKKILGTSVKIASIPSLIEMKRKSGRNQDLEDIRALESIAGKQYKGK